MALAKHRITSISIVIYCLPNERPKLESLQGYLRRHDGSCGATFGKNNSLFVPLTLKSYFSGTWWYAEMNKGTD